MNFFKMIFLVKKEIKILIAIILLAVFLGLNVYSANIDNDKLRVNFFDVGQGDGIFIQTPDGVDILIDGGPGKNILEKLNSVMPFYDKHIDILIITHEHEDHLRGAIEVMNRYKIDKIYYNDVNSESDPYAVIFNEIAQNETELIKVKDLEFVDLGKNKYLEIYSFSGLLKNNSNINNTSLMTRLSFNKSSFLFMADIEADLEENIIRQDVDLNSDFIKIAHHGSSDSSSANFLNGVSPDVAVITVGLNNDLGHPSRRVIKRLERKDVKIYRTDLDGDIVIILSSRRDYMVIKSNNH
jgi:competence protein ComEC